MGRAEKSTTEPTIHKVRFAGNAENHKELSPYIQKVVDEIFEEVENKAPLYGTQELTDLNIKTAIDIFFEKFFYIKITNLLITDSPRKIFDDHINVFMNIHINDDDKKIVELLENSLENYKKFQPPTY